MGGQSLQERFAIQFVDGCYNTPDSSGENMGYYSSLALQMPFDVSSHIVPDCPA